MIATGKYQDDIEDLKNLDIKNYERIFKIFTDSINDKEFYYYNILKKIDFPVLDSKYLSYYTVKARTPLTTVSYNIYEDILSWWILYLLNKDKFVGAPFYAEGGTQLAYISKSFRTLIYDDIAQSTVFSGRHF